MSEIYWTKIKNEHDMASYTSLYNYYYKLLCDFSYSFLKNREQAEEAVDDVFVMLWVKKDNLVNIKSIKPFLYTCTRNISLDILRKNKRSIDQETSLTELDTAQYSHDDSIDYEMAEFSTKLNGAVETLPKRCKLIFKMHKDECQSYMEIAKNLNLSKKTVETQVYIAYRKLEDCLRKIYE